MKLGQSKIGELKNPQYTLEILWDAAETDATYITSTKYAQVPHGSTSVVESGLKPPRSSTQKVDPISGASTIGSMDFSVLDIGLTEIINSKLADISFEGSSNVTLDSSANTITATGIGDQFKYKNRVEIIGSASNDGKYKVSSASGDVIYLSDSLMATETNITATILGSIDSLRNRKVRAYVGELEDRWEDYQLINTQLIDKVTVNNTLYQFSCSDIIRSTKVDIFEPRTTKLLESISTPFSRTDINATGTAITVPGGVDQYGLAVGDNIYIQGFANSVNNGFKTITFLSGNFDANGTLISTDVVLSGSTSMTSEAAGRLISISQSKIVVQDPSLFEMIEHGSSYGDLPNTTCGYIRINDMIVSYQGITASGSTLSFDNCILGALNTIPQAVGVDGTSTDNYPEVKEIVYLEMPVVKLIYAILTGDLKGDQPTSGAKMPSTWHLGISTSEVSLAHFTDIGSAIWDTTDDTKGIKCRFVLDSKIEAKRFIETELNRLAGVFLPILNTGAIAIKKFNRVNKDAHPVMYLDNEDIVSTTAFTHNLEKVRNVINVGWDYIYLENKFARINPYIDDDSIEKYKRTKPFNINLKGLSSYTHTDIDIQNIVSNLLDRFAEAPVELTITGFSKLNLLYLGDIVSISTSSIKDFNNPEGTLNLSFEVQEKTFDWSNAKVTLKLQASTSKNRYYELSTNANDYPASEYLIGTDISTLPGYSSGTLSGYNFVGGADMNDTANIYRHTGNLTLDNCTFNDNVQLRIDGILTQTGLWDGVGRGLPGGDRTAVTYVSPPYTYPWDSQYMYKPEDNKGTAGGVGSTQPPGALPVFLNKSTNTFSRFEYKDTKYRRGDVTYNVPTTPVNSSDDTGFYSILSNLRSIENNGSTLLGIPNDLRGTSGAVGGFLEYASPYLKDEIFVTGNNGGAGGSSILCIAKGYILNGLVDLSGAPGSYEDAYLDITTGLTTKRVYAPPGAGGAGGALVLLVDGNTSLIPRLTETNFRSKRGESLILDENFTSYYKAFPPENAWSDAGIVLQVPPAETVAPTVSKIAAKALDVSISILADLGFQAAGYHVASVQVDVTPTTDANYSHSIVQYLIDGVLQESEYIADNSVIIKVPANGSYFSVRVFSVSTKGVKSNEFFSAGIVLPKKTAAILDSNNSLGSATDLGGANSGFIIDKSGLSAYEAGNTNPLLVIDSTTGKTKAYGKDDKPLLESGALSIVVPRVTGLKSVGGVEVSQNIYEYATKDIVVSWRETSTSVPELTDDFVADTNLQDWWLDGYIVKVSDSLGNLLWEERTRNTNYTFTYEKNKLLGLYRDVIIDVYAESIYKDVSNTASRIKLTNPTPDLPTDLSINGGYEAISIKFTAPVDTDYDYCEIHISTDSNFTPGSSTLLDTVEGKFIDNKYSYYTDGTRLAQGTAYTLKLRFFDSFGIASYTETAAYRVKTNEAAIDIFNSVSDWAHLRSPADYEWINTKLADDAVPSTKIVNLTAAKITSGIIDVTVGITVDGTITVNGTTPDRLVLGPHTVNSITRVLSFGDGSNTEANYPLLINADGSASFGGDISAATGTFTGNILLSSSTGYINLTGTNSKIYSGKTSYTDSTAGWWLGRDSDSPKFNIGDASNYIKWDSTNGVQISGTLNAATGTFEGNISIPYVDTTSYISIGSSNYKDTGIHISRTPISGSGKNRFSLGNDIFYSEEDQEFTLSKSVTPVGVYPYNTSGIHIDKIAASLDGLYTAGSGITASTSNAWIEISSAASSGDSYISQRGTIIEDSSKYIKGKCTFYISGSFYGGGYFQMYTNTGTGGSSTSRVGFKVDDTLKVYGIVSSGASDSTQFYSTGAVISTGTVYTIEYEYDTTSDTLYIYINGTKYTINPDSTGYYMAANNTGLYHKLFIISNYGPTSGTNVVRILRYGLEIK